MSGPTTNSSQTGTSKEKTTGSSTSDTNLQGTTTGATIGNTSSLSGLNAWDPTLAGLTNIAQNYAPAAYDAAQSSLAPGMTAINNAATNLYNGGGYGQGIGNLESMSGALGQTANYLNPIASGSMIGQDNPYLQGILGDITDRVNNQIGSQFAASGRPLGTNAYGTRALARGLSEGLANPLFQNYQFERGQQMAGISGLQANAHAQGGIPGLYDAVASNKNNAALQGAGLTGTEQSMFWNPLLNYQNLLMQPGQAFGSQSSNTDTTGMTLEDILKEINTQTRSKSKTSGQTSSTGTSSTDDGGAGIAGTVIAGLGLLSDRRAKEGIEPVGCLYDGQIVYRYRYKGDDITQIGLMADEVENVHPEAVYTNNNGFKLVDYKLATEGAVR